MVREFSTGTHLLDHEAGLVYDYKLHDGGFTDPTDSGEPAFPTWLNWMRDIEEYKLSVDMKYSDIEVPTIHTIRNSELLGMILMNEDNVLCVGPTGTGKALTVIAKLSKNMHKKFICDFITFSARTSANQTQHANPHGNKWRSTWGRTSEDIQDLHNPCGNKWRPTWGSTSEDIQDLHNPRGKKWRPTWGRTSEDIQDLHNPCGNSRSSKKGLKWK